MQDPPPPKKKLQNLQKQVRIAWLCLQERSNKWMDLIQRNKVNEKLWIKKLMRVIWEKSEAHWLLLLSTHAKKLWLILHGSFSL